MADLKAAYLAKLQKCLRRRVSVQTASDLTREIDQHLLDSIGDLRSEGMDSDAATLVALERIGDYRSFSDSLIRAHSGITEKSTWRIAAWPIGAMLLYVLIQLVCMSYETPPPFPELMLWVPSLILGSFFYLCWRSRRILLKPVAIAVALVGLGLFAQTALFSTVGITPFAQHARERSMAAFEASVERQRSELGSASRMLTATSSWPSELRMNGSYMAPRLTATTETRYGPVLPWGVTTQGPANAYLAPVSGEAEARGLWQTNGAMYVHQLQDLLKEEETNYSLFRNARLDWPLVRTVALNLLTTNGTLLAMFAALNFLALGIGRVQTRVRNRRWRPERLA